MVVADQQQHAAMWLGAGGVGVADDVHAAVDARAFAVPHGEDAVVARAGEEAELLAAPDGGGGQIFVDARAEDDVLGGEKALRAGEFTVEPAERGATVAGDEAGGVQPGLLV